MNESMSFPNMKKSELKANIKEEILSLLQEDSTEELEIEKDITKELEKQTALKKKLEESEDEEYDMDMDTEPTKKSLKKDNSVTKLARELQNLIKDMKALAKKYKEAEGDEKLAIVKDLKYKTKLKNELEALI